MRGVSGRLLSPVVLVLPVVCAAAAATLSIGCRDRESSEEAGLVETWQDQGSMGVRLTELWRVQVRDRVGSVGGMAAWDDGTIWIGDRRSAALWEMEAGGWGLELVREEGNAGVSRGGTLAMASIPGGGMLILSRNGVAHYSDRDDLGTFSELHRAEARGFAVLPGGDYVVSYGQYPDDPHVQYGVHRYALGGRHVASWHPAFVHDDWVVVTQMSGGPVAVTRAEDILVSDPAPFRITRYYGGRGDSSSVVVEDDSIVSASQLQRALPKAGTYSLQWDQSVFIDEMSDGRILNIVNVYRPRGRLPRPVWVVVSAQGDILARTQFERFYGVFGRSETDRYLAVHDGSVVELEVAVEQIVTSASPSPGR